MPSLRIQMLGDFRLMDDDSVMAAITQARHQALLAYLLLHRHAPQSRQQLAFLLWPDSSEAQAQTNLRKALAYLRQAASILAQAIYADRKVLQWQPAFPVSLDVAAFEEQLTQATAAEQVGRQHDAIALLAIAVDFYAGPLLPSCYDDWLIAERERLHQLCLKALEQLVTFHERQRDLAKAIHYAQQLLRLDPLQETTYLHLMRLQALQGDRAGALRTYHTCATMLERELNVEPGEETQAAYARLLKQEPPAPGKVIGANRTLNAPATRLVGRQTEWAQLQAAWRLATQHRAHFVFLLGEAGIGKTRLAEEMLAWAGQQGLTVARTRVYAGEGQLAYAPVTEWLRAEPLRAVRPRVAPVWLSEVARLLPEILAEQSKVPPPAPMTERWQRQQLWEALARTLLVAPQPLLLLIDDLQWCDQETLEWLRYFLHFEPRARVLIMGTARPEEIDEAHPLQALLRHLRSADQLTEIELGPLDAEQTAVLAAQVAQQTLDSETQQALYRATAGNPLFVVETVRAGIGEQRPETRDQSIEPSLRSPVSSFPLLPPKVQSVIQSRLAQLSPTARDLARLAAVIGRAFTFELLVQASGHDEDALARALDELWQRRIIREQGMQTYDFSHDRFRDVAYVEINPIRQRQLHRRIAAALEERPADELDTISGELGFHYEQAGRFEQAILAYQSAVSTARKLYAYQDATHYIRRGLALLKMVSPTHVGKQREIDLLISLGELLRELKGITAPEVGQTFNQALALCRLVGTQEQLYNVQSGLRVYYNNLGQWSISHQLAKANLALAQMLADQTKIQHAHMALGIAELATGTFSSSLTYFEQALSASIKHWPPFEQSQLPIPFCLPLSALCLWLLGYPNQSFQRLQQILIAYQKSPDSPLILADLEFTVITCYLLNDIQTMLQLAETIIKTATKYDFPFYQALGALHSGFARAYQDEIAVGLTQLQQGIAFLKTNDVRMFTPYCLAYLVNVYRKLGQNEPALAALDEALTMTEQTGEYFWYAELLRLRGEILLASGVAASEVETWYQRAFHIAQQQQAKLFELRATMSLARLWQQQGRMIEAYQALSEIYNWFTEGFNTADLQEAKALLAALAD
ncbi:MAG: BTAD domain-containing putative transcriptional regulator [Caldilineaceae bacterium]